MISIYICIDTYLYACSCSTRGRMCMPAPGPRMKVLLSSIGRLQVGQPFRRVGAIARRALYSRGPACHAMGARGSPRKKRWVGCQVGAALGCPPWGIWGLKAEQGPRRAALSAPTGALFRVSGFGERKCRYHATWYADRAHPGYWIAPLEAPGRNPSRAQVASLPRKAPGISSKKDH
jgi:hypothetical protein